jgi:putative membrane protein
MTETTPFSRPTRQSTIAIVFILGKIFRILVRQLWAVILIVLFNPKKQVFNSITLFILALAAVGAVISIISWFNYYFFIKDGELRLEKGVFRKSKINVPLDRIQTVNFKQTLLHQAFNVVSIEIDTAGSVGKEFSLQALKREQAEALRDYVENYKSKVESPAVRQSGIEQGVENQRPEQPTANYQLPTAKLLFRLTLADLMKIGISQNHLRTAGIIMAFFISFLDDLENALNFNLGKEIDKLPGMVEQNEVFFYLLLGVPFFLTISFLFTLVRTVLRYFGLQFWRTERGFKMNSGLFTRNEVSVNLSKIQFLRWSSSPLKRLFGMTAVRVLQAASVQVGRKLAVDVPGCYQQHLTAIRHSYFPEEKDLPFEEHRVHPRIIRRQMMVQGLLPAGLLMLLTWSWLGTNIWIWALWLPTALWLSIRYYRNWRWHISEAGLRTAWGVFNRQGVLLQWYKVQAVTVRQSWFQRRYGLSSVVFFTAAGAVNVPYIPLEKARAVQDFVLYKIETDRRDWM